MVNSKDVILMLKNVKAEKNLSLDKILSMIEENGEHVSKTTLSRVFADGSEEQLFRYETTLRPIANALLDIETIETYDDTDTRAYKSILKLKKDLIAELRDELKTVESKEKAKYTEKLNKAVEQFQKTLAFYEEQISLKDKRIDQLLDANIHLINNIVNCPYRPE